MKNILITILLISSAYAVAHDNQITSQPRSLVAVFKEKHEQESLLKKIRTAEQEQKAMTSKIKQACANVQFSESIKQSYKKVLLCVSALCAVVGTAAIIHHLIGDFSFNASPKG